MFTHVAGQNYYLSPRSLNMSPSAILISLSAYWLDRMDAAYGSYVGRKGPLKEKPGFYSRRNV
jgi:hypothetical protein